MYCFSFHKKVKSEYQLEKLAKKKASSFEEAFVPGAGIETPQFGVFENFPKTV